LGCFFVDAFPRRLSELFGQNLEEELAFLKQFSTELCIAKLLGLGRIAEAGRLHFQKGNIDEALQLLTRDPKNQQAIPEAARCLMDALWDLFSLGLPAPKTSHLKGLLGFSEKIPNDAFSRTHKTEVHNLTFLKLNGFANSRTQWLAPCLQIHSISARTGMEGLGKGIHGARCDNNSPSSR
jgi:hypothetical protein